MIKFPNLAAPGSKTANSDFVFSLSLLISLDIFSTKMNREMNCFSVGRLAEHKTLVKIYWKHKHNLLLPFISNFHSTFFRTMVAVKFQHILSFSRLVSKSNQSFIQPTQQTKQRFRSCKVMCNLVLSRGWIMTELLLNSFFIKTKGWMFKKK